MNSWKSWKHKNIILFAISVLFAFMLTGSEVFNHFLLNLGDWGYIGAFFAGLLFVLSFTAATGIVIIFILAESLSPLEIGIIAGLGAMVGDLIIFRFVKDGLTKEIDVLYQRFGGNHFKHVLHSKYFRWTLPVIGAFIIASPLPDELGASLMGISKMKTYKFIILSFMLNAIGIFIVVTASLLLKRG